jgi:TetR/AcrR family transcriptional repressor of nem operon
MSSRTAKPETREALLSAARTLFLRQGYTATGIDEICAQSGLTKGALFHYFADKEALGMATLERWIDDGARAFSSGAYLHHPDPLARALGFVDFAIELSRMGPPGCIAGIFTQELAPTNAKVREACSAAFSGWVDNFEGLIGAAKAAYAPASDLDPRSLAQHALAVLQGSLILARAHQRPEIVAEQLRHFRAYLAAQFRAAGGSAKPRKRATPKTD